MGDPFLNDEGAGEGVGRKAIDPDTHLTHTETERDGRAQAAVAYTLTEALG